MLLPSDYAWLESYLSNDSLWIDDALSWEAAFELTLQEFSPLSSLLWSSFHNEQFFLSGLSKFSFLDSSLLNTLNKFLLNQALFFACMQDAFLSLSRSLPFLDFCFQSDYQNLLTIFIFFNPELNLALEEFITFFFHNQFFQLLAANGFDIFSDHNVSLIAELLPYLTFFFILFVWIFIFFISLLNLPAFRNALEAFPVRLTNYLNSLAKETRLQTEVMYHFVFFGLFYLVMALATFDDDREEVMEFVDSLFVWYFLFLIAYLVYKYSIHYFAFLEATETRGRTVAFVTRQFFRDIMGSMGLFLRFFILLFRLNVYDNLDDFYDSYYIFVGDFDEDEYWNESLVFSNGSFFFFENDANDDVSFLFEDETDFFLDFYYLYFMNWGKLFFFLFFIVEELFRISLALYIAYLIIFEIHAVNCSYDEDSFFRIMR